MRCYLAAFSPSTFLSWKVTHNPRSVRPHTVTTVFLFVLSSLDVALYLYLSCQRNAIHSHSSSMELLPPSLLWLPADVWGCILSCLCPKDVCAFSCSTSKALHIACSRRRGVLLARHWGRLQVRAVRQHMQARGSFVRDTCSMEQLHSRESCQAQILETLRVCKMLCLACWRSSSSSTFPLCPLCMARFSYELLTGASSLGG